MGSSEGGDHPKKLILAAAEAALYDDPPPADLREVWLSKKWGLPNGGGRNDQPFGYIRRLTIMNNVYEACSQYRMAAGRLAEWSRTNPDAAHIVSTVLEMRIEAIKAREHDG